MGLIRASSINALKLSPKSLFRSKKDRSLRSDPSTFSYGSSSSDASSSVHRKCSVAVDTGTPTSVLPDVSGEWSDIELLQAFKFTDRGLSRKELEALLCRLGSEPPTRDEVDLMLTEIGFCDGDDACVSVEALLSRVGSVCGQASDVAELRGTFDFFDVDHDGRITAEELLQVFAALGNERCTLEDCRRMIAEVDKNMDGFVCFEDFARMMDLQT